MRELTQRLHATPARALCRALTPLSQGASRHNRRHDDPETKSSHDHNDGPGVGVETDDLVAVNGLDTDDLQAGHPSPTDDHDAGLNPTSRGHPEVWWSNLATNHVECDSLRDRWLEHDPALVEPNLPVCLGPPDDPSPENPGGRTNPFVKFLNRASTAEGRANHVLTIASGKHEGSSLTGDEQQLLRTLHHLTSASGLPRSEQGMVGECLLAAYNLGRRGFPSTCIPKNEADMRRMFSADAPNSTRSSIPVPRVKLLDGCAVTYLTDLVAILVGAPKTAMKGQSHFVPPQGVVQKQVSLWFDGIEMTSHRSGSTVFLGIIRIETYSGAILAANNKCLSHEALTFLVHELELVCKPTLYFDPELNISVPIQLAISSIPCDGPAKAEIASICWNGRWTPFFRFVVDKNEAVTQLPACKLCVAANKRGEQRVCDQCCNWDLSRVLCDWIQLDGSFENRGGFFWTTDSLVTAATETYFALARKRVTKTVAREYLKQAGINERERESIVAQGVVTALEGLKHDDPGPVMNPFWVTELPILSNLVISFGHQWFLGIPQTLLEEILTWLTGLRCGKVFHDAMDVAVSILRDVPRKKWFDPGPNFKGFRSWIAAQWSAWLRAWRWSLSSVLLDTGYNQPATPVSTWSLEESVQFCRAHEGFHTTEDERNLTVMELRAQILEGWESRVLRNDSRVAFAVVQLVDSAYHLAAAASVRTITDDDVARIDWASKTFMDAVVEFEESQGETSSKWVNRPNFCQILLMSKQAREFGSNRSIHMDDLLYESVARPLKPEYKGGTRGKLTSQRHQRALQSSNREQIAQLYGVSREKPISERREVRISVSEAKKRFHEGQPLSTICCGPVDQWYIPVVDGVVQCYVPMKRVSTRPVIGNETLSVTYHQFTLGSDTVSKIGPQIATGIFLPRFDKVAGWFHVLTEEWEELDFRGRLCPSRPCAQYKQFAQ